MIFKDFMILKIFLSTFQIFTFVQKRIPTLKDKWIYNIGSKQ